MSHDPKSPSVSSVPPAIENREASGGVGSGGSSATGESPELAAAYTNLVKAAQEYGKLAPQRPEPTEPPLIVPTLLHATPSSFHRGYNMVLDAGGYMPGKIPVMVIPARPEDLRAYACFRRAKQLRAVLGLSLPNQLLGQSAGDKK